MLMFTRVFLGFLYQADRIRSHGNLIMSSSKRLKRRECEQSGGGGDLPEEARWHQQGDRPLCESKKTQKYINHRNPTDEAAGVMTCDLSQEVTETEPVLLLRQLLPASMDQCHHSESQHVSVLPLLIFLQTKNSQSKHACLPRCDNSVCSDLFMSLIQALHLF